MWVPSCGGCKIGKYVNHISSPSSNSSSTLHDSYSIEKGLEWLMNPTMMIDSFVSQDVVIVNNSSLKGNPNFYYPL